MITQRIVVYVSSILLLLLTGVAAMAQPQLPDVSCKSGSGLVLLSWTCQYNGVRSISVLRSADSTKNFSIIGNVKKLQKGVQAFVDGHPAVGKNYYKLNIVFNSGLNWGSNHCMVVVEKADLDTSARVLPANDSLQRYIVTGDPARENAHAVGGKDTASGRKPPVTAANKGAPSSADTSATPAARHHIAISFDQDSLQADANEYLTTNAVPLRPKKKIVISFDDPDPNSTTFVKSRFIFTDEQTGHIHMYLPDDVSTHHYSVRFFNQAGHLVTEVPRINSPRIILDKRNFHRKGMYKFILRRDVIELESGYIYVN